MEQTPEMMQQELNAIKIRCFDAESARDKLVNECQQYNGALTAIADKLGIMKDTDGVRTFELGDVDSRLSELLSIEETHLTPALPLVE